MCFKHTFGDFIASALILNFSLGLATNSMLRQTPGLCYPLELQKRRTMKSKSLFEEYKVKMREFSHLGSIAAVLSWDQQTMAPAESHNFRGKQMAALSKHLHRMATTPENGKLLQELYDFGPEAYDAYQWRSIEETKRSFEESTRIPEELVARCAELGVVGHGTWQEARKKNEYSIFEPVLREWIELRKKISNALYPDKHPYDVCLDCFERGLDRKTVDSIFNPLQRGLIKLQNAIWSSSKRIPDTPAGPYEIELQKKMNRHIASWLGFSFEKGRLDESSHPFSVGLHQTDVRMTTRYEPANFISSLLCLVHETGHSLYEQGLPLGEYEDLPVSGALGLVVHESQSLLFERRVGQSSGFWKALRPSLIEAFPFLEPYCEADLYEIANRVEHCPIRINADEVTYPMHIILRYELERDLFDGTLDVSELPEAWNQRSKHLLGIDPESDAMGVLQDAHWSDGSFGYFPVYTLGAMYGSQLFDTARSQVPTLDDEMGEGQYDSLLTWLRERVHQKGRLLEAFDLLKEITGKELDPQIYLDYLWKKYSEIYNLDRS
jgi:carboxypeptidase Taq